jgi:hypothetical protein
MEKENFSSKNMKVKQKVDDGRWFMDTKCGHAKIEITCAQLLITTIFQQLNLSDVMEDKQKFIQFAIVFNLF